MYIKRGFKFDFSEYIGKKLIFLKKLIKKQRNYRKINCNFIKM